MANSKIELVQMALGKLGIGSARMPSTLDQAGSNEAYHANLVFDDVLKELLVEHPWSFAQKRLALTAAVPADTSRTIDDDTFAPIAITGATQASPVVITSDNHGLVNGDKIVITGVAGMTELNGNVYYVTNKTNDTFSLVDEDGDNIDGTGFTAYTSGGQVQRASYNTPITITAATQADPVQITTLAAHGLATDDWIKIIGVNGMTELNGNFYQVTVLTTTTFTLKATSDSDDGDGIDGSAFTAYTHGGVILRAPEMPAISGWIPVVYLKPDDLVKPIKKSIDYARISVERDKIISQVADLSIIYTYLNENVSQYYPKFVQALVYRLAAELAFPITNSSKKAADLMQLYHEVYLPMAISSDSTQGEPDEVMQDEWLDQLMSSSSGRYVTNPQTWHPL